MHLIIIQERGVFDLTHWIEIYFWPGDIM